MYSIKLVALFAILVGTVIFIALFHFLVPRLERLYLPLVHRLHGKDRLLDVSTRHGLDWRVPGIFKRPGFSGHIDHRRVEARLGRDGMIRGRVELSPGWYSERYVVFGHSGRISISDDELISRGITPDRVERLRPDRIVQAVAPVSQTADYLRLHKGALEFAVAYQHEEAAESFFDDLFHAAELLSQPPAVDEVEQDEPAVDAASSDAEAETVAEAEILAFESERDTW